MGRAETRGASLQVEVAIVGSGTAGLSALREVRRATEDFVLVNAGSWGTTCASVGCMPSKALIEAANAFHRRLAFDAFGLRGAEHVRADVPAVLARVRRLRDGFVAGPTAVRDELGERAIAGRARLIGPDRLDVDGREIRARRIVLATGSRPTVPSAWRGFGERILTSDTLFELDDLPARVAVVGLGPLGAELAQALARLGVDVAGFDAFERVAGIDDAEIAAAAADALGRELALHLGAAAELEQAGGALAVSAGDARFTADAVLVAIGRTPNVAGLGLESLGVQLDEHGLPDVDPETLRIGDLPVWLVGDANGRRPVLHEAADEGHIAGRNAVADEPLRHCRRTELSIVFTSPGIARVGPRRSELDERTTIAGSADFSRQSRARMAERADGLLHVYAEREGGRLLGAEMCVPGAEHLAHLVALALERSLTVHEMLAMPFYHPVLEEGLRSALRELSRQLSVRSDSDLATCPNLGFEALD